MITNWNNKQIVIDNVSYSLSTSTVTLSKTSDNNFYNLNGSMPSNTNFIVDKKELILNHKYILKSNNANLLVSNGEITNSAIIFTNYSDVIISIVTKENVEYSNSKIGLNLFDLTAMGLDSITTVAEFNALFPNDLYQYTNGTFSSSITSLSSKLNGSIKDKINIGLTLNGLGNVMDTWEEDVLTKKIGKVKLKDLTISYISGTNAHFIINIDNIKKVATFEATANILCNKYISTSMNSVYSHLIDKSISGNPSYSQVLIYDSSYENANDFINALTDDDVLYYELATPTVEDKPLNADFLLLENGSVKIDGNDYDSYGANLRATISFDNDTNESQTEEVFTSVEYAPQGEIYVASNKFRETGISSYPLRRISDTIFDYRDYLTQYNRVGIGRLSLFDFTYEDGLFKVPLPYGKLGGALKFKSNSFVQTDFPDSNMNAGMAKIGGTVTNRMLIIKASQTSVSDFREAVGTDVVLYELSSTDEIDLSITRIPLLIPNNTTRISDDTFVKSIDSISYYSNEMPANYDTYTFVNSDVWTIEVIDGYDYLKVAVPNGSTEMDTNVGIYKIDNNGQENLVFGQDSMFPPHIENSYLYLKVGPAGAISQSDIPEFTSLLISMNVYVKYEKEE